MMEGFARLICIVVACVIGASTADAYRFTSPEGKFTAEFPAAPTLNKTNGKTESGIPYDQYMWSIANKDGSWAVAMGIYSKAVTKDYDANIRGAVTAVKGKLLSQKIIEQSGAQGREIPIDVPPPNPGWCASASCGSATAFSRSYSAAGPAPAPPPTWMRSLIHSEPINDPRTNLVHRFRSGACARCRVPKQASLC